MVKLFKSIDEQLEDIGFIKLKEDEYGACYVKDINQFCYRHRLDILHKASGNHIVQSYEEALNSVNFNNCVGLTAIEMKLAYRKLKQLSKKYKW